MDHFQYTDLPQIPFLSEDHPFMFSAQEGFGQMNNLQPMQRFLQGIDPAPFAPELLHSLSRIKSHRSPNSGQYEAPWPSADFLPYGSRNGSPDTTSAISSQAPQNELHSPHHIHSTAYGNPDSYAHNTMSYPSPDASNGAAYPAELVLPGNNINLRDIELHHEEPEPRTERHEFIGTATTVVESEFVTMTETTAVDDESYIMDTKPDYKSYQETDLNEAMPVAEEVQPMSTPSEESDSDYKPYPPKGSKRRRSTSSKASGKANNGRRNRKGSNASAQSPITTKVTKRARGTDAPRFRVKTQNGHSQTDGADLQRPFPCPFTVYGCQSDFASKNEWKRHVSTQHIKLGFWRCDLCPTTVDPHDEDTIYHNDFNRKDLFTQHLRRMHAPPPNSSTQKQKEYPVNEDNIAQHQHRCYQKLRSNPPKSSCLFCDRGFSGAQSWDECIEHVGRHLEKDRKSIMLDAKAWKHDAFLEGWLVSEGLIEKEGEAGWRLGNGKPLKGTEEDE